MSLKNLLLGGLYVCLCICMFLYVIYIYIYIYTHMYMLSTSYGHYKLETVGKVYRISFSL